MLPTHVRTPNRDMEGLEKGLFQTRKKLGKARGVAAVGLPATFTLCFCLDRQGRLPHLRGAPSEPAVWEPPDSISRVSGCDTALSRPALLTPLPGLTSSSQEAARGPGSWLTYPRFGPWIDGD